MFTKRYAFLSGALITLLLATSGAIAQVPDTLWTNVYNGGTSLDEFHHVEPTSDGGFIMTGSRYFQFWVVKVNSAGQYEWGRGFGPQSTNRALYACEDWDGSFIVIGVGCLDNVHCGSWWVRASATGDSLGSHFLGNGVAETARRTSDRGFILPGSIQSNGEYGWLLKTDSVGTVQWAIAYNTINEEANCITELMGGGYILGGKTQPGTGFLRRVSATGLSLWRRAYSGSGFTHILGITQTADSGFVFTGFNYTYQTLAYYLYLQKVTFQGDSVWSNSFGISTFEALADLAPTEDHGFIVAGYHSDSSRAVAARTDSMGHQLWLQTYKRNNAASFASVLQTADGGYLLAGTADTDGYLVRLEPEIILTAPLDVTLYRVDDDIVLRWAADSNPAYRIYSSATPGGPYTTLEGSTTSTSLTLSAGGEDTQKFFIVVGWNGQ